MTPDGLLRGLEYGEELFPSCEAGLDTCCSTIKSPDGCGVYSFSVSFHAARPSTLPRVARDGKKNRLREWIKRSITERMARPRIYSSKNQRLYFAWKNMRQRCRRSGEESYRHYSHVTVCDEWENSFEVFQEWALANGYADDLTIDRIDCHGGYHPDNCRWIGKREQQRNKRNNRRVTAWGEEKTVIEWVEDERCTVAESTVYARLDRGMPPEEALTLPPDSTVGRRKLTDVQVEEIRQLKDKMTQREIAALFGVSNGLVAGIHLGKLRAA